MTVSPIPRELLNHAYGTADDVPPILDALRSNEPSHRAAAAIALSGNVYHQGTRYSATSHACRVVAESVKDANTPRRDQLWELLQSLSVDGCQRECPCGRIDEHCVERQSQLGCSEQLLARNVFALICGCEKRKSISERR